MERRPFWVSLKMTGTPIHRFGDRLSANVQIPAGLSAGVTEAVAVVTPMEVIKIRLQAQHHSMADPLDIPKYRNAAHALYTVVKEEGIGALYRGVSLTALRQGMYLTPFRLSAISLPPAQTKQSSSPYLSPLTHVPHKSPESLRVTFSTKFLCVLDSSFQARIRQ